MKKRIIKALDRFSISPLLRFSVSPQKMFFCLKPNGYEGI